MLIPDRLGKDIWNIKTLRDSYKFVNNCYSQNRFDIDLCQKCIQPFPYIFDSSIKKWIKWINNNICIKLGVDSYYTTQVKLRIAAGMLNNIKDFPKTNKLILHENLCNNVNAEINNMIDDELPF